MLNRGSSDQDVPYSGRWAVHRMLRHLLPAACFLLLPGTHAAQSIFGRWVSVDDNTGKRRSIVEISERDGKAYGRIAYLFEEEKRTKKCNLCPADRKDQPVLGMEIIRDMVKDDDEWEDGTILDPDNGKVYDCKLWVEDGQLQVRGYIAFFFRTQTWVRE